jgi:phosphoesterase RecJ-like protein
MSEPAAVEILRHKLGAGQTVLISTHVHPDPDAIGSVLAAAELVEQLGGRPRIIIETRFAPRLEHLPGTARIESFAPTLKTETFHTALIVDCGNRERVGTVEELLTSGLFVINVDHHVSNDQFGDLNIVDVESAATGELLFLIARDLGLTLTPTLATNLFAGMLTDTGRFRYSSTRARTLSVAAELRQAGADVTFITNALYYDLPEKDIRSMGSIYATLEMFQSGRISTLFARSAVLVEDPDSIVDLALSIRGVEIASLLSETESEKIRVSLRSKTFVNVSKIASFFGGGGHERAAGFRMTGTLESVRATMLPVLSAALEAHQQAGG